MAKNNENLDFAGCTVVFGFVVILALIIFWGFKEALILSGIVLAIYVSGKLYELHHKGRQGKLFAYEKTLQQDSEEDYKLHNKIIQTMSEYCSDGLAGF